MLPDLVGKTSFIYHVAKKWNNEGLALNEWTLLHASYTHILMNPTCFLGDILNSNETPRRIWVLHIICSNDDTNMETRDRVFGHVQLC
jgi:hypothetical protein